MTPPLRPLAAPLTTSVVIPCSGKHAHYLYALLELYERQTCLPDEVVISLSDTDQIRSDLVENLERHAWPFRLTMVKHRKQKSAGMNRNLGCAQASGDILICQDADDQPHPQRVEIVKFLFERYEIDHLMHSYNRTGNPFVSYRSEDISMYALEKYDDIYVYPPFVKDDICFHNGNICLRKAVAKEVSWEDSLPFDKDVDFNRRVYARRQFTKIITPLVLIQYRPELSSYNPNNQIP